MAGPASIDYSVIVGNIYLQNSRYLPPNGDKPAMFSFRVAVSSRVRDPNTNEWTNGPSTTHFVTAFGRLAENCHASFHERDSVFVVGRNRTRSYEQNGEKRYSTDLIADNAGVSCYWAPCEQKNENRGNGNNGNSSQGGSNQGGSGHPAPADDTFANPAPSGSEDSFDPFANPDNSGNGGDDDLASIFDD